MALKPVKPISANSEQPGVLLSTQPPAPAVMGWGWGRVGVRVVWGRDGVGVGMGME